MSIPVAVPRRIPLEPLAWLTALWPLLAVHAAYLVSAQAGLVPWCLPYVDGCTSISRAGRQGSAVYLFRATMLPYSLLLLGFWMLTASWCRLLVPERRRARRALLLCGGFGAGFLALYVSALGVDSPVYQWLRRYGINLHFSLTVLAQMFLISIARHSSTLPGMARRAYLLLMLLLLGLGLVSLPLQFLLPLQRDAALNALEWQYALLMLCAYPLTGYAWRRSGFVCELRVG